MDIKPEDMIFSAEKIAEMAMWNHYQGFSGESCGKCKATTNVFAGGPGWVCPCGHYNVQSWFYHQTPHEQPDYGPLGETIIEGHKKGKTGGVEMLEAAAVLTLGVLFAVLLALAMQVVMPLTLLWAGVGGVNFFGGMVILVPRGV